MKYQIYPLSWYFRTTVKNLNLCLNLTNLWFAFIVSPIPEIAPIPEKGISDPVSAMCQQLSQGLSLLSSDDFIEAKQGKL